MFKAFAHHSFNFEEYCVYDDGSDTRYELFDGELIAMPPPLFRHLLIAEFLADVFKAEIKREPLPYLVFREAGIRTGIRRSRIADICVATPEQLSHQLDAAAIFESAPLLVVEIVSASSIKQDYRYKRSEYAVAAIPEYWIVDPIASQIMVLRLEEGLYEQRIFKGTQWIESVLFPELSLTVEQVLAAGNVLP